MTEEATAISGTESVSTPEETQPVTPAPQIEADADERQPVSLGETSRRVFSPADYRVLVSFDGQRSLFVARAPELDHCQAEAPTRGEAVAKLDEEIDAIVANIRVSGREPPTPVADLSSFSGDLQLKLPKALHRDLTWQAKQEGVSIDHLAAELLGRGLDGRTTRGRMPRPGDGAEGPRNRGERGPGGSRYHGIMDDRAHFIEYVRGLESGARPGGGGGGGGGRGRGRHR